MRDTPFDRQMRRKQLRNVSSTNYQKTLSRAHREAQAEHELFRLIGGIPPRRGTPEWDQRERARAALGCWCLSFGDLDAPA